MNKKKKKLRRKTKGHTVHYQPNVGDISYAIDVFNRMMGHSASTGDTMADAVTTATMMEELDGEPWYEGMTVDDKFLYLKNTFPHVDGNWAIKVPDDIIDNVGDWAAALREVMHDHPSLAANAAIADGGWVVFAPTDGETANYIDYSNSDSVEEWAAFVSGDDSQPTEEGTRQVTDGIERDFLEVDKFNANVNKIFNIILGEPIEMSESKKMELRESIAALDHASENEYSLTALYEAVKLDAPRKLELAKLVTEGKGALAVYRKLVEWYDDEEVEDDEFLSHFVDDDEEDDPELIPRDKRCPECGMYLNDMGTCPRCDEGDEDTLNELGPVAGAVIASVAPVVADRVLDRVMGEDVEESLEVYNGTDGDIDYTAIDLSQSPEVGLHCGTEKACRERGYETVNKLILKAPSILALDRDMDGYWSSMHIVDVLRDSEAFTEDELAHLQAEMREVTDSEDKYLQYSRLIRELVLSKGYNVISYPNEVEDEGSTSYIVLDPSIIHTDSSALEESAAGVAVGTALAANVLADIVRRIVDKVGAHKKRSKWIDYKNYLIEVTPDKQVNIWDFEGEQIHSDLHTVKAAKTMIKTLPKVDPKRIRERGRYYESVDETLNENNKFRNARGEVMADKWYASRWPDDEVGIEQLEGLTLDELLKDRSLLRHCDTQVRDRVSAQLDKYVPLSESLDEGLFGDYKEYEEFTEDDIALHKSIDWEARDYQEYPVKDDTFLGEAVLYTDNGSRKAKVTFMKFIRPNPIYPPYYRPVHEPFPRALGPMYDGHRHGDYDVHDRYESQSVYDSMFESYEQDEDKPFNKREVFDELKRETREWTKPSDTIHYGFESEYKYALDILKKHYKNVEGTEDWHITFSEPLRKKK